MRELNYFLSFTDNGINSQWEIQYSIFFLLIPKIFKIKMAGKFVNYVVFPVTTIALLSTVIRAQAKPSKAYTKIMKQEGPNSQGYKKWQKMNDGLGVNDVGRSCGGV